MRRDQAHLRVRKPKQTTHDGTSRRRNGIKHYTAEQVPRGAPVARRGTVDAIGSNGINGKGQT